MLDLSPVEDTILISPCFVFSHIMDGSRRGSGIRIEYAKQKMGAVSQCITAYVISLYLCMYSLVDQLV